MHSTTVSVNVKKVNNSSQTVVRANQVSPEWKSFIGRLVTVLEGLQIDSLLTLQSKISGEWVQFSVQQKNIRVECKSNAYRDHQSQLSQQQVSNLLALGWFNPTGVPSECEPVNDPYGSPNFFRDLPIPLSIETVTDVVTRTFKLVFAVDETNEIEYEAFEESGDSLSIPTLGVRVVITCSDTSQTPKLPKQVIDVLRELTGIDDLEYDDVGDLGPIRFGSIKAFVRLIDDSPYLRMYVPILSNVQVTHKLLERLNELNCEFGHLHLCVLDDCITAVSDLLVSPFKTSYLGSGLANFLQIAECWSVDLVDEFSPKVVQEQQTPWQH